MTRGALAGIAFALGTWSGAAAQEPDPADPVVLEIQSHVEALRAGAPTAIGGDVVHAIRSLPLFYEANGFRSVWRQRPGEPAAARLIEAILAAAADGLDPADYHLDALRRRLDATAPTPHELAELDLLLTDAFLLLGSHLLLGRVHPETLDPEWLALRRNADLVPVLEAALESGDPVAALDGLRPRSPRYAALREGLLRLRRIDADGGWGEVDDGDPLEPGMRDPRVAQLRRRLGREAATPDAGPAGPDVELYDEALAASVRAFQARHGLTPDGVVGRGTLAALNVPAAARARQVEVNLERWRWLPEDLGDRHVEVNIPGFSVELVDRGETTLRLRAIVGRQYTETPSFSGRMTYLVLNPTWHVPLSIAVREEFPAIKRDPSRLEHLGFELVDRTTNEVAAAADVDWEATPRELSERYALRQGPGPQNALGVVKFMFPNAYNVYLHDTPGRNLFAQTSRGFSHGCVRVERPLTLADALLAGDARWTPERVRETVEGGRETTVMLQAPVPVHLLYWTAVIDRETGDLGFREDLYGRDARVRGALDVPVPGTGTT